MKAKRMRWVCPECGRAILAPSRLRRTDPRRYCLKCSGRKGAKELVERRCPVQEKRREKSSARRADKRKSKASKRREDPREIARSLFVKYKKLWCWRDRVMHAHVSVTQARRSNPRGTAWPTSGKVNLRVGWDWAVNKMLVLHELAHVAAGPGTHHGDEFRSVYAEAAREVLGDYFKPTVYELGRVYDGLDAAVTRGFRDMEAALKVHLDKV